MAASKAIFAAPPCEVPSPCRGLRPHHVHKDRVGTWETSCRPKSHLRLRSATRSRGDEAVGKGEESDGCVLPMKPRTKPMTNRRRRVWRQGGRSEEGRAATHGPDSAPGLACDRSGEPTWPTYLGFKSLTIGRVRLPTGARCGKPHAGICGRGAEQSAPLPDSRERMSIPGADAVDTAEGETGGARHRERLIWPGVVGDLGMCGRSLCGNRETSRSTRRLRRRPSNDGALILGA